MNQASRIQIKPLKDTWLHPSNIYFWFSLLFGILFVFIIPPFQVADEWFHFYRIYQISEGVLLASDGEILQSVVDFTSEIAAFDLRFKPDHKISKRALLAELFRPLNKEIKVSHPRTYNYTAINYMPQTAGVLLGRVFNFSPYKLLLTSRLINLLVAIFLTTIAIKICPIR